MKYTIVEDCSPYYIIFTAPEAEPLLDYIRESDPFVDRPGMWWPFYNVKQETADKVFEFIPEHKNLDLVPERIFISAYHPGYYYGPHKDGENTGFAINLYTQVLDDKCVVNWFTEEDVLSKYEIYKRYTKQVGDNPRGVQRVARRPRPNTLPSLKSLVAKQGQCVMLNTDIYHDFFNDSPNHRVITTARPHWDSTMSFDEAKRIMFGL